MPPKNTIELSEGRLYFNGLDEPLEVHDCEVRCEPEYADDQEPYIKNADLGPVTLTVDNVEFPREWVLVKCKRCGYEFPITEFYSLLYGTKDWTCPKCIFEKTLEDARKRADGKEN